MHAILATRRDLPLRLHQLRLAGELAEIRAADLRFTERETRELLDASGIALSDAGAALLHQRTEGWAAGLRLAAISLAGHPDPERFVAEFSGSDRTVAEYLIAEMLERQPDDVQQLLLRTSLLDRVNGELADLLTGRAGSERILLDLEDANAFVVSLDPERTWFRYHHLFADLLRLELRRTLPDEVPALHRRAAGLALAARPGRRGRPAHAGGGRLARRGAAARRPFVRPDARRAGADHPGAAAGLPAGRGSPRAGPSCAHDRSTSSRDAWTRRPPTWRSPRRPPGRRHRIAGAASDVAIASLRLSLARRRGHLAGVVEQARFLASPVTGQSDEDIALGNDLRAVALMNLGIVEAWSLGLPTPNATSGRAPIWPGRSAGRTSRWPAWHSSGSRRRSSLFATTRRRCREAIALAEQHGWGAEPIIAPALVTLAGVLDLDG